MLGEYRCAGRIPIRWKNSPPSNSPWAGRQALSQPWRRAPLPRTVQEFSRGGGRLSSGVMPLRRGECVASEIGGACRAMAIEQTLATIARIVSVAQPESRQSFPRETRRGSNCRLGFSSFAGLRAEHLPGQGSTAAQTRCAWGAPQRHDIVVCHSHLALRDRGDCIVAMAAKRRSGCQSLWTLG